jgi:predicted O-linked N-acetylglucosamine transferase (SPINDLY family)
MATISQALAMAIRHYQAGRLQAAEQIGRRILQAEPDQADAIHLLGVIAHRAGEYEVAVRYMQQAIALRGDVADFHCNLAGAYYALRRIPETIACCRRALELEPNFAQAHYNLGNALKDQRKLDEAVACFRRALQVRPDDFRALNNLGVALKDLGHLDEAVACYRQVLQLRRNDVEPHNNLGIALGEQGRLEQAIACYRRALELDPADAEVHYNLGSACKDQGRLDEALACYRRALELKPDYPEVHSSLLAALQYCPGVTPAGLAEAHAEFDRRYAAPLGGPVAPRASARALPGRLRVGFVSRDLGRHPVGYFLVRALENLDPAEQETICYSDRIGADDLTRRFQAAATEWRDVNALSDQRLAEQIRADAVDVLFDLAGHTAHNRLLTFARKPAPIQVTWAGYVGTTGLKAMDYILADRHEIPPESEAYYCEKVLRMPDGYVCFEPPDDAPPVGPLPATAAGHVTFGCFNNPAKITPQVVEVWARILRRLPRARLVLKFKGWDDRGVARRFADLFAAGAIDPGRLEFLGWSSRAELLDEYNRVDLALDSFPYCGGLTTCEALWMGVPVVTCPMQTFASRHSLSHLCSVGLTQTIAHDLDQYVELAVSLAADLPRLAELRAGLRQQMAASPLCDGKRFAAHLTAILHDLWRRSL